MVLVVWKVLSCYWCTCAVMLDLEKRTPEQEEVAANALKDSKLLSDLLEGLFSNDREYRYNCFKALYLVSEDHPSTLYPRWEFFEGMLKSDSSTSNFQAIHILANLARVDSEGKFEKVFDRFFSFLEGNELIPASHVAYVSHKIVRAKPELVDIVMERLLNLDGATYKHVELVQANALGSFSEFFDRISAKDRVVSLARELLQSNSAKAKKEAAAFLKKWNIK